MKKNKIVLILSLITFFICQVFKPTIAESRCKPKFLNPITEIGWKNLFPFKIGGVTIIDSDQPDAPSPADSVVCACLSSTPKRIGVIASFWEPYRIVESVVDPGCFTSLGFNLSNLFPKERLVGGIIDLQSKNYNPQYAAQAHFVVYPVLYLLELLKDVVCGSIGVENSLDIAYITEIDPTWQDDKLSLIFTPEAILFANPILGLACIADSMLSAFGKTRNELFWCLGTWYDSVYPFVKTTQHGRIIEGAASISARLLYKMHRLMLVRDANSDPSGCKEKIAPIWKKRHWRFQPIRPKAWTGGSAQIGKLPEIWAYRTNLFNPDVQGSDNWAFLLWRKVTCCLGPPLPLP